MPASHQAFFGLLLPAVQHTPSFDDVYETIQAVSESLGMRCHRADDIWDHDDVVQGLVSLINRARVVVCDFTGRNANVFYEAGIAHTLGRDVIIITQDEADVPFDLQRLRYLKYDNNRAGRELLHARLTQRMQAVLQHRE